MKKVDRKNEKRKENKSFFKKIVKKLFVNKNENEVPLGIGAAHGVPDQKSSGN